MKILICFGKLLLDNSKGKPKKAATNQKLKFAYKPNPQREIPAVSSNSLPVSSSSSSPAAGVNGLMELPRASAPAKCMVCTGCLVKDPCQECSLCLKGSSDCLRRRCKEKMRFYNEQQRLRKELAKRQLAAMESGSSPGRRGSWLLYHPREVLRKMFLNPVREAMVLEVKILL